MANRQDVERALLSTLKGDQLVLALVALTRVQDSDLHGKTVEEATAFVVEKAVDGRRGGRSSNPPSWWKEEYVDMELGKILEDLARRRANGDPSVPSMPDSRRVNSVRYRYRIRRKADQ